MQHKNFFMVPNRIFDLELKPRAKDVCFTKTPTPTEVEPGHLVACHYVAEINENL